MKASENILSRSDPRDFDDFVEYNIVFVENIYPAAGLGLVSKPDHFIHLKLLLMPQQKNNKLLTIIWLSLLTGTLDGILSIIFSYPASPEQSYRYIASGLFGAAAFSANYMVFWGVLFHYLIASTFSSVFFLLYPNFKRVINNKYILAFVFGLIIWIISSFVILPLSNVPDIKGVSKYPSQLNLMAAIISFAGLSLCLGLPISLIANKYYRKNAGTTSQDLKLSI